MSRFVVEFSLIDVPAVYRLEDRFETFVEADRRASVIAINGARICLDKHETIYVPYHRVASVTVVDRESNFLPTAECVDSAFVDEMRNNHELR